MECLQYTSIDDYSKIAEKVLNLVISGMPSILTPEQLQQISQLGFKPCYKWNAFNTRFSRSWLLWLLWCFKPCYKWNAFNTGTFEDLGAGGGVLNLVISGMPSIHKTINCLNFKIKGFKPCYKWNAFNTREIWNQEWYKN